MMCPVNSKRGRMELGDDGTLDTVIRCSQCGAELRYNFDGEGSYSAFVKWAKDDARSEHEAES